MALGQPARAAPVERDHGAPVISVAIASYNGAAYIGAQLESILCQTVLPDEIVVSDDGSSDSTLDILAALRAASPLPIRVLTRTTRLGVVANFEQAILATTGDIVFLADHDDIWNREKIAAVRDAFAAAPDVSVIFTDAQVVGPDRSLIAQSMLDYCGLTPRERGLIGAGRLYELLLSRNIATGATMAFRRSILGDILPFPDSWLHDEWIAIVLASRGAAMLLPQELIEYRQHAGNALGARQRQPMRLRELFSLPMRERRVQQARRYESLVARLAALPGLPVRELSQASEKALHLRVRASLPSQRWRRVAPILREWRRGRYSTFSRGLLAVARDMVQRLD
jgi:hypothetical protein